MAGVSFPFELGQGVEDGVQVKLDHRYPLPPPPAFLHYFSRGVFPFFLVLGYETPLIVPALGQLATLRKEGKRNTGRRHTYRKAGTDRSASWGGWRWLDALLADCTTSPSPEL